MYLSSTIQFVRMVTDHTLESGRLHLVFLEGDGRMSSIDWQASRENEGDECGDEEEDAGNAVGMHDCGSASSCLFEICLDGWIEGARRLRSSVDW